MKDWSRRSFVSLAAGAPALAWLAPSPIGAAQAPAAVPGGTGTAGAGDVFLSGDGLHLTPAEHAALYRLVLGGQFAHAPFYGCQVVCC